MTTAFSRDGIHGPFGDVELSKAKILDLAEDGPLVVGAVADGGVLKTDPSGLSAECDLVELRLDSLGTGPEVLAFATACPLPLLITCRGKVEGGAGSWSTAERTALYRALLPFATAIDIEVSQLSELKAIRAEAEAAQIAVVGSFHDFEKTPELDELQRISDEAGTFFKVATLVRDRWDLEVLFDLLEDGGRQSVMGMGPLGVAARPVMAAMGSLFNYGYLGESPTAPGQWRAGDLKRAIQASRQ